MTAPTSSSRPEPVTELIARSNHRLDLLAARIERLEAKLARLQGQPR